MTVVVKNPLYPLRASRLIGAISHDIGIFNRNTDLIIKTVRHPALNLLLVQFTIIHHHMIGMMNVVIAFHVPNLGFKVYAA